MYVSGLDLSVTAAGIATAHGIDGSPADGNGSLRVSVEVIGRDGVNAMTAPEKIAVLDDLGERIYSRVIHVAGVVAGPIKPDLVIMEEAIGGAAGGHSNGSFERGYLYYSMIRRFIYGGIPFLLVKPQVLKLYLTGSGVATKGKMIEQAARRFPAFEIGGDDNAADAVAACGLAAALVGHSIANLPAAHLKALDVARGAPAKPRKRAAKRGQ